jgi:hypothetical protein
MPHSPCPPTIRLSLDMDNNLLYGSLCPATISEAFPRIHVRQEAHLDHLDPRKGLQASEAARRTMDRVLRLDLRDIPEPLSSVLVQKTLAKPAGRKSIHQSHCHPLRYCS